MVLLVWGSVAIEAGASTVLSDLSALKGKTGFLHEPIQDRGIWSIGTGLGAVSRFGDGNCVETSG